MKAYRQFLPKIWFVYFLIAFAAGGVLSACQRASTAYLMPTPRPAHQRLVVSAPVANPLPDSSISASLTETPVLATSPAWKATVPAAEVTTEAAIATVVRPVTVWSQFKRMMPRKPAPPQCDQIVLRNGDVVDAKVKEVGVNEIRYKKCDRPDGPDYTISKRDVLSIKYSNGEVERFSAATSPNSPSRNNTSYNSPTTPQDEGPRTDPFAIVAISAGGLAIFTGLGSILLGAAAVVFGAMSLSRIRREPNRFKGKGLALAGMVIGIVAAAAILLYVYIF